MDDRESSIRDVLDAKEAAAYLKLNEQTVRRLARDSEIPAFKVGGSWRFKRSSLDRWALSQEQAQPQRYILLVDDEAVVRDFVQRVLEANHFTVQTATSGETALRLVAEQAPDLILLDLHMPGMTGPEVLREIKLRHESIPVIILTGFPDSALMEQALEYSPVTLLSKPATPDRLLKTVKSLLKAS